jgi:hypothetical protein
MPRPLPRTSSLNRRSAASHPPSATCPGEKEGGGGGGGHRGGWVNERLGQGEEDIQGWSAICVMYHMCDPLAPCLLGV